MIHLRPQRVYKPTASSGNPNNSIANYLDRYYNQGLYRLRLETPRGTSLTEDNSQITCYAHFFNNTDGSEVTDRLKGRDFRPTWLLNDKPIDSTCISEDGYLLTLDSAHLTDYTQTVTLQALDTEILSALSDEPQFDLWLQQTLKGQGIQPTLLKQSETLINFALVNKKLKVGGRNLFRKKYFIGDLASLYKVPFDTLQPRDGDNTYTLTLDYKISPEDKASSPRITCMYSNNGGNLFWDSDIKRDGEWHHKEYTIKLDIDPSKYPIYGWFTDYGSNNGRTIDMVAVRNIKLERGTVATDWTPAPEDVDDSISKVNTSLASLASTLLDPDQGEIHKLTSQLVTSAKQTLAEAIKRAGEMDKQIKVGGRNLIVTSRWKAGYLYGDRDETAYPVGSENYKVLVGYDTFRFDPVYIPTLGESKVTYKLYDNGGSKNGTVQIHAYDKDKKFLWWSVDGWDGTIGHTNAWTLPIDTAYIRLGVTNENVRAKVEFGTVVTDWTPAPEDVAESVSSLESKLLDPQQGEISKLEKLLGKHSESFEELATHPLTVDEAGYWKIWSVKDSKYLTTHYPSRGEAGHSPSPEDVLVTTRFAELLGGEVTKQITPISQDLEETTRIAREGVDAANYSLQELDKARKDIDGEIAQAKTDLGGEINNLYSVTNGMAGDLEALDTGVSNALDKADMAEKAAVDVSERLDSFKTSATTNITNANTYIDNAFAYISNIIHYQESSREYTITSSGRVSSSVAKNCSNVQKDLLPTRQLVCQPPIAEPEIRLVLYSDYESLRSQVAILTTRLAQLEARTTITPFTNSYNRAKKGHFGQVTDSIYPLYGDWLLTSDAKEQKIYFSGLRAEIGRSIYIQTRKKAYLNANGHSFYGLPSVSENQWLSNNTTYRFVRASDTAWLVTASSSPYPWT